MNLVIPPVLLYAFGVMLVTLGGLRAYYLGWRKRPDVEVEGDDRDAAEDQENAAQEALRGAPEVGAGEAAAAAPSDAAEAEVEPVETVPATAKGGWARSGAGGHKRHLMMGLLYVVMGLFLIVSTALGQRR